MSIGHNLLRYMYIAHYQPPGRLQLLISNNIIVLVNCGNPANRINDSNICVEYEQPPIEGSYANFSCYTGHELHSAECMGNGEWVPDPQELEINCTS